MRHFAVIVLLGAAFAAKAVAQEASTEAGPMKGPEWADPARESVPAAEATALKARVEDRWKAIIDRDFDKAYGFETPEYRDSHTPDQYKSQFGPFADWHLATVKDISYDAPGVAKVGVVLDVSFNPPSGDPTPVRTETYLDEIWVNIDGQWWRRPVKLKYGAPAE